MRSTLDPERLRADVEAARELFQRGSPALSRRRFRTLLLRVDTVHAPSALPVEVGVQRARLLLGLAAAEFEVTGDLAAAMRLIDESALFADRAPDLAASVHGQRGLLLLRRGETGKALAALDEAVRWLDAAAPYDQMTLLLNRGALHLERGALAAAEADLARCAELAARHGERLLEWKALHNLGYVDFLAGRLPRALAALERAEAVNPGEESAVALLDRARVLREAGLVQETDALLSRVAGLLGPARLSQDLGETELLQAECALVAGDPSRALRYARSALRRFVRRGNLRWQRRAELLVLRCERGAATDRTAGAGRVALLRTADRAAALVRDCRSEGRFDLARAAALLERECRLRAGGRPAERVPVVRRGDPLQLRLHVREVRALHAAATGAPARALLEVRRGLAELGDYQHSFGSLDLRTASAVHGSSLARVGLEVALRDGSPATVLRLVEQARAVSTRLPQVRPPDDPATAALLSELRRTEEEARSLVGDPTAGERVAALRGRVATLQRAVRARAWEVEGAAGHVAAAPLPGELGAAARADGAAFVCFARSAGRWIAVVTGISKPRVVDLADVSEVGALVHRARADLDALARPALPPALREAVRGSLDLALSTLDALVCAPLRVGGRRLVASCSGDLLLLPWGLLPSRLGVATVVTPSAASWLRGRERVRSERPVVAAVAGPGLRLARREVEAVGTAWPGSSVHVGDAATGAVACRSLVASDLVHVAAHGDHRQDNPLFSCVRLADGPLYAYEIDPGAGLASCVVLSACEAGLATVRPGDESLGLSNVLLQLGAACVVAAVARVNDEVSAGFMRVVHEAMARGVDSATAVADATLATAGSDAPPAYVCSGSW